MSSPDRLMSVEEVAEYLGVTRGTIYTWRWKGKGPRAYRVGHLVKYRVADVERWLEDNAERRTAGET